MLAPGWDAKSRHYNRGSERKTPLHAIWIHSEEGILSQHHGHDDRTTQHGEYLQCQTSCRGGS